VGDHTDEPGHHGSSYDGPGGFPERVGHHGSHDGLGHPDDRGGVGQRVGQRGSELLEGVRLGQGLVDQRRRDPAEQPGHHRHEPDAGADDHRADDDRADRSAEHDDAADRSADE
jgi:hypothetical protein